MSDWTQLIETGFQKLSELAGKYGPPAIDTAAQVVQVDAIGQLMRSGVALVVPVVAALVIPKLVRIAADDNSEPAIVGIMLLGAGAVGTLIYAAFGLLDIWNWAGAFNPKLALAAKVVHAIPGMGQ